MPSTLPDDLDRDDLESPSRGPVHDGSTADGEHRFGGHEQDVGHASHGDACRRAHSCPQSLVGVLERDLQIEELRRRPTTHEIDTREKRDVCDGGVVVAVRHRVSVNDRGLGRLELTAVRLFDACDEVDRR